MTSHVHAERRVDCPFSVTADYALKHLREFEAAPIEATVRLPLGGLRVPFLLLRHRVRLRVGIQRDTTDSSRRHDALRLVWWSESGWIPNLSGILRFRIVSHRETQLLFDGAYTPPLGMIGAAFDRLLGRHLAKATAGDLLARIGSALETDERAFRAAHSFGDST